MRNDSASGIRFNAAGKAAALAAAAVAVGACGALPSARALPAPIACTRITLDVVSRGEPRVTVHLCGMLPMGGHRMEIHYDLVIRLTLTRPPDAAARMPGTRIQ